MAEVLTPKTRWLDKPTARAMAAALGLAVMSAVSGATWIVKSSVESKVQEARTEEHFRLLDRRLDDQGDNIKEMKEDLKELVRRPK